MDDRDEEYAQLVGESPSAFRLQVAEFQNVWRKVRKYVGPWILLVVAFLLVLVIAACSLIFVFYPWRNDGYEISFSITPLNDGKPFLTPKDSVFMYNYNAAFTNTWINGTMYDTLAVRVQNATGWNVPERFNVTPSMVALSYAPEGTLNYSNIHLDDVVISPEAGGQDELGCEDPRVVYVEDKHMYLMFYTSVANVHHGRPSDLGNITAKLSLAVSYDDHAKKWEKKGVLFPGVFWSKSGALLVREDSETSLLFWGDKNISIAETRDFLNYTNTGRTLLNVREDHFDSLLVESGPPPEKLSDGNYLFLYNSARNGSYPSPKVSNTFQYNVGYAILDKNDPTHIIKRSQVPLMTTEFDWMQCKNDTIQPIGLTPWVIFVEGWKKIDKDVFLVYVQGCDAYLGAYRLEVHL